MIAKYFNLLVFSITKFALRPPISQKNPPAPVRVKVRVRARVSARAMARANVTVTVRVIWLERPSVLNHYTLEFKDFSKSAPGSCSYFRSTYL